jgi:hypothetical protein
VVVSKLSLASFYFYPEPQHSQPHASLATLATAAVVLPPSL